MSARRLFCEHLKRAAEPLQVSERRRIDPQNVTITQKATIRPRNLIQLPKAIKRSPRFDTIIHKGSDTIQYRESKCWDLVIIHMILLTQQETAPDSYKGLGNWGKGSSL